MSEDERITALKAIAEKYIGKNERPVAKWEQVEYEFKGKTRRGYYRASADGTKNLLLNLDSGTHTISEERLEELIGVLSVQEKQKPEDSK